MLQSFNLVVIGSGTAASVVASTCRSAGWSVAIIDSQPFGGTCALRGCDPKKVLVGAAELVDWSRRMQSNGVDCSEASISWRQLIHFKRSFTDPVPRRKEESFEKMGVHAFHGRAHFVGPKTVEVKGDVLDGDHIVIAAGAKPAELRITGEQNLINSTQFLNLEELPKKIVFVGGGYIAMEFAHVAVRAGAQVTVLHRGNRVLKGFDADLVELLVHRTRELGVIIHTDTAVEAVEQTSHSFIVHAKQQGRSISFDCDLAVHAAGRVPDIDDLNLEALHVQREKKGVIVNGYLQSVSNPAVYAGGDAAASGGLPLTPVAGYDGKVIAANLLGGNHVRTEYDNIPTVVFTVPALASVGMSECAAAERGLQFRTNYSETSGWYSSRRIAEKNSAYKVLLEQQSNRILGAHLLGPMAEETINLFALAMHAGMTAEVVKQTLFAYPTHASDLQYML
jgi:glutathione reductase (NADPH)